MMKVGSVGPEALFFPLWCLTKSDGKMEGKLPEHNNIDCGLDD